MNFSLKAGLLAAIAFLQVSPASALTWRAAIRERMMSPLRHPFGGDASMRVRREVQDLGFTSFTLVTRMQMNSPTESAVYAPPLRSQRSDLETMIMNLMQGRNDVVLKPMLIQDGTQAVASRITHVAPSDPALWFATYQRTLNIYVALALRHEISEVVVATGLAQMWKPAYAADWTLMLSDLRKRLGPSIRLSIEVVGNDDLAALENWMQTDRASFEDFARELNSIRYVVNPVVSSSGIWDAVKTSVAISSRHSSLRALFPKATMSLANLTVPACRVHAMDEDEVICQSGFDKGYQIEGIASVFKSLRLLTPAIRADIAGIELLMATTDSEPVAWDFDPRFPFYNDLGKKVLKEEIIKGIEQAPALPTKPTGPDPSRKPSSTGASAPLHTACVYYDHLDANDFVGVLHARMLTNLMGTFPNWNTISRNSIEFQHGDTKNCTVVFYIATTFGLQPPTGFLEELAAFSETRTLVWMNYRFPDFVEAHKNFARSEGMTTLSFNVSLIEQPLQIPSPTVADPGFYRYFEYKGETFVKLSKWDVLANRFMSSPELNIVQIEGARAETLSWARHSTKNTYTPYVVRERRSRDGEIFYFADSPFSFVHYEDRYLIFCDLMWDILREQAPVGPLGALVRIEDVNPSQDPRSLRWAIDYLAGQKVPFSLAVIPFYANIFGSDFTGNKLVVKPDDHFKEFVGTLRFAKTLGANIVWHGVYHQAGDLVSGYDGTSGDDYEFWLYPENTPIPGDSPDYVLDQLEKGEEVFLRLGLRPLAWEVPHYAASALDSLMFGKLFEWNYHRSLYFWSDVNREPPLTTKHRMFDCLSDECRNERRLLARKTNVEVHSLKFAGQPIPFRVWKDSYGQALIPETLGMIDYAFYDEHTWRPISSPEDLLRRAKLLRVIRGSFASFFWHPDVLSEDLPYYRSHPGHYEQRGGKNTLIRVVEGLKAMGYEFKSIGDCSLFPRQDCTH